MIYLLRHGDSEQGDGDDAARKLTEEGKRQAENAGKAMARLGVKAEICLTSPKLRARDTAQIACRHLGVEIEETDALLDGEFDPSELAAGRDVLLVGHDPAFSNAVAQLTGARVKLKKGGLACAEGDVLAALLRPAELAAIATG